jgi:hypothetical protein
MLLRAAARKEASLNAHVTRTAQKRSLTRQTDGLALENVGIGNQFLNM